MIFSELCSSLAQSPASADCSIALNTSDNSFNWLVRQLKSGRSTVKQTLLKKAGIIRDLFYGAHTVGLSIDTKHSVSGLKYWTFSATVDAVYMRIMGAGSIFITYAKASNPNNRFLLLTGVFQNFGWAKQNFVIRFHYCLFRFPRIKKKK